MNTSTRKKIIISLICLMIVAVVALCACKEGTVSVGGYDKADSSNTITNLTHKTVSGTSYYGSLDAVADNYASSYVLTRHKSLGGSHYAYTEGITDDFAGLHGGEGNEANFAPGSQLSILTLTNEDGQTKVTEKVLIESPAGVVRDPDVSADGRYIVFSWKKSKNTDDYHLYVYDLEEESYEQITFGQGISDTEPKWMNDGRIVFSSSRCVQIIDCWKTPISNLYTVDADGKNMIRVGYDQVTTTYPTVAEDGRVLYTRWDYNDRTQMYVHGVFSMNSDGTGQTAVFGNNSNNPTSQLHTVGIPGSPNKYFTVVAGHHVYQGGKLALVDTSVGRDGKAPFTYLFGEQVETGESVDTMGQSGAIYKYPYAINECEVLYAKAPNGWAGDKISTSFNIYYSNLKTGETVEIANNQGGKISCSQICPIRTRTVLSRPSSVDYSQSTGTYYVANVYEGDSVKTGIEGQNVSTWTPIEFGSVKYLRVVALEYRSYAVGAVSAGKRDPNYSNGYGTSDPSTPVGTANCAWDLKMVLGIVPVEEDGSVLFECPADLPVYFQLLDENGMMIQSMRSWSTLMPGEVFSCVGCHENKNSVPVGGGEVTLALKKGVQRLQKDIWMTTEEYDDYDPYSDYSGFSYSNEIQPILDKSCIVCHTNVDAANTRLGSAGINKDLGSAVTSDNWKYVVTTKSESIDGWNSASFNPGWSQGTQPFGSDASSSVRWGSSDDACFYMTQQFNLSASQLEGTFAIRWQYDEDPVLYINGHLVADKTTGGNYITSKTYFDLTPEQKGYLKEGTNVITARAYNAMGGSYMSVELMRRDNSQTSSNTPVALTSELRTANRDKVDYKLSYLVLTGSFLSGNYYCGTPENDITNWIGGMSNPEIIPAYSHGATQSNLIKQFMEGGDHAWLMDENAVAERSARDGVNYKVLTASDLARMSAWIDLGVPYRGKYNEASENWGALEMGEAERRDNMRAYYDTIDKLHKKALAGELSTKKLTIEYYDARGSFIADTTERGLAVLNLDQKLEAGGSVTVILPKGQHYVWFSINPKMKFALMYCPNETFTYTIPSYGVNVLPNLTVGDGQYVYTHPTITAYLPSEEDLSAVYNVAMNPYDVAYAAGDAGKNTGSLISSGSVWENDGFGNFVPQNAFDGFTNNRGHGSFPVQSWGANKNDDSSKWTLKVDFNRTVELYSFVLYMRADFPHDAAITSLTLEFSDGSTVQWNNIESSNQAQTLELDKAVQTTYVIIKDIQISKADWFGISEFEAYGINITK